MRTAVATGKIYRRNVVVKLRLLGSLSGEDDVWLRRIARPPLSQTGDVPFSFLLRRYIFFLALNGSTLYIYI